ASPSKQILKAKAKPFPPCTHCGFNVHRLNDCQNYPECEICGSYDHFTLGHNRVIHVRGGILAESSQSNESSIGVRYIREHIWYLDSRCSRSMTGIKIYLHKYVEQPGPKVVFGDISSCITEGYGSIRTIFNANKEIMLIAPRRNDIYVLDISSLTPNGACFFAKALESVNWLWYKRLSHLNFKNINKLAKQNKVLGLPSIVYSKDKPCSRCEQGKHKRALFKTKQNFSIRKCLHLLYMDLFRPTSPMSVDHEKYTLVIVDEYSRYTWVYFLRKKSHAAEMIMSFIRMVENQNDVKIIDFSYTPEQNSVAEGKNRTLIEAARTMLNGSDRWSKDQHIKLVNIIGDPGKDLLTRSMAAKLELPQLVNVMFGLTFLSEIEPKPRSERTKARECAVASHAGGLRHCSKWVFKNKKDEHGIVTKNKARLVVQGYSKKKGIDYDETCVPVARMEAIRIFLAFATYMNVIVFQKDVKSAFLECSLLTERSTKGMDDKGISICQEQYTRNLLKKYEIFDISLVKTPMVPPNNLRPDLASKPVNETMYRGMIGSLMYLTATRPDIQFSTVLCARYQSNPKESHLIDVKRIFRDHILKGDIELHFIPTEYQLDDIFTKPLDAPTFTRLKADDEWQEALTLDFKTFITSIGLDYNNGDYVAHPSPEAVKAELAKIVTNPNYLNKTSVLKNSFPVAWRILFTFVIQVDIGEIIYSDLVTDVLL
ncbi:retrovirus-related pol polyprotein from transposon TNT 1-94, partial [Tanacetum coccineum]